jgi:hypothetical protein
MYGVKGPANLTATPETGKGNTECRLAKASRHSCPRSRALIAPYLSPGAPSVITGLSFLPRTFFKKSFWIQRKIEQHFSLINSSYGCAV